MVRQVFALFLAAFFIACQGEGPERLSAQRSSSRPAPSPSTQESAGKSVSGESTAPQGAFKSREAAARAGELRQVIRLAEFQRWFSLSTPGEKFISDNIVSNETCLPETAEPLSRLRGGVYFGVGPEQNFHLIAWSRPELAFIVDIRRDNALLHLFYKALFGSSRSRIEFLSLLLGRPSKFSQLPAATSAEGLIAIAERSAPNHDFFEAQHRKLVERIRGYRLNLSAKDLGRIHDFHRLFFERQLDLRFEMRSPNGRNYPALRELLTLRSSEAAGTFLDTDRAFQFLKTMQEEHRIIPVVGDVGAKQPLGTLARELQERHTRLSVYYISNVEQYLLGTPSFSGWRQNLSSLPLDDESMILRVYLDQGRPHPRQQAGHRSTPVLHRLAPFLAEAKRKGYASYFALVTDDKLLARWSTQSETPSTVQKHHGAQ